jgi:large subunit ribosomal protein L3
MTQVWNEAGKLVPVTVIELAPNVVTQIRTPEKDGYNAVQIAAGEIDPRKVTQPLTGHYAAAGVTPRRKVAEIRTADAANYTLGQEITAGDTFEAGQLVDVVGTSKGKGFAGVMKRHNFAGVGASHGAHRNHRKPGSIGASATPSRVFKGTRMAGRMGDRPQPHGARRRRREGSAARQGRRPRCPRPRRVRPQRSEGGLS